MLYIMNRKILKNAPILDSCVKIKLSKEDLSFMKAKLSAEDLKKVKHHSKRIHVYKLVYFSNNHKVMGFCVLPKNLKNKVPCIIWNRGGSNDFGAIKFGRLFTDIADFALNGYIVFASQYSGNSGSEGVDEFGGSDIYDVLNLYKIIKLCPQADIARIGMYGHSRGGLMTYLSLAKVKWLRAAVAVAAPSDEVNAPDFRKGWREHQIKMYGGGKKELIKRSAVYWADKFSNRTPLLMMHGSGDWRVNPQDSIRLSEKLLEHKKPFRLIIFEGGDHGLTEFKND